MNQFRTSRNEIKRRGNDFNELERNDTFNSELPGNFRANGYASPLPEPISAEHSRIHNADTQIPIRTAAADQT